MSMLIAAAGSVLPWLRISVSRDMPFNLYLPTSGWYKDGKITVFLAVVTLAFFLIGSLLKSRWPFVVSIFGSLVVTGIMIVDLIDIVSNELLSFSNVGYGLYVGLIGGMIGIVCAVGGVAARRT